MRKDSWVVGTFWRSAISRVAAGSSSGLRSPPALVPLARIRATLMFVSVLALINDALRRVEVGVIGSSKNGNREQFGACSNERS